MNPLRAILHVDMDAFYAAVEVLDDPELAGKPVIVGGAPDRRGVVSAASYEARAFGVRSAMPSATAVRLCPHAVFLSPRGQRYAAVSRQVMAILGEFTPTIEKISVDEAFLDVSGSLRRYAEAAELARRIKDRVTDRTRLTCSVGVAPNKFLAKLASDLEKPDGLTVVPERAAAAFIAPLPVDRIWGVGPRTAERLQTLGIRTIGQLAAYPPEKLARHLGDHAEGLQALARGEDHREVQTEHEPKSISRETTFAEFLSDLGEIEATLLALADDVAKRLRAHRLVSRTVTLKVRDERFETCTRSVTLPEPTDLVEVLYDEARRLFRKKVNLGGRRVRLLGVAAGGLAGREEGQGLLFPDPHELKRRRLAEAVDRARAKFGPDAVTRGRLLKGGRLSEREGWEAAPGGDADGP